MNLLQIVQEFCQRTGLPAPSQIIGAQDDQLTQLAGLANEVCEDLVRRHSWTTLIQESVFTSVAGEDQGAISTIAPRGFLKIQNETIFDRTSRLPITGPLSPPAWQADKALVNAGPFYQYRFRGGHLLITPGMPAGNTLAFEYTSEAVIFNSTDNAYKSFFTKDADEFLLDKSLLIKGLRWRWKEEKGLPYAEAFRGYESAVAEAAGGDGSKSPLSMSDAYPAIQPGVFVPAGNWNLP